jgi:amino acid transporter
MDMTLNYDVMNFFVPMLIVGIGVALLATGMFTSYFGAGKSQKIGFALLFFGIVILALVNLMTFGGVDAIPDDTFKEDEFKKALTSGIAALGGVIAGMFIILFVLMKVDTVDDLEDLDLEDLEDLDLDEELKKLEEELNQTDENDNTEEEE